MDTPQVNPQRETPQNNGSSTQKKSWFRRHPIISVLIVLILIGSVMNLCGSEPDKAPSGNGDRIVSNDSQPKSENSPDKEHIEKKLTALEDALVPPTSMIDVIQFLGQDLGQFYEPYLRSTMDGTQNQIELEEGKSIDQFFVIKKCLNPCLKSPSTCYEKMDDYYHESIFKLVSAIVQLDDLFISALIHDKLLTKEDLNSADMWAKRLMVIVSFAANIYWMAGQNNKANALRPANLKTEFGDGSFSDVTIELTELSPVGRKILNSDLDFKSKQRLIGIWIMRQVPYAVKDIINSNIDAFKRHGFVYTPPSKEDIETRALTFLDNTITYESKPADIDYKKYIRK